MHIVLQYRWLIILTALIAAAAGLIYSYAKPVEYDTSISFFVNRINIQETEDYQYDGYYAIQASDLFSQNVMSWMMTPSVLLQVYDKAGIDPQIKTVEQFTSRFRVRQYSPQNIAVRFRERDEDTAQTIADAIIATVQEQSSQAIKTESDKSHFEVVGATPVIVEKKPIVWLNTLLALVAGLLIGLAGAYAIAFVKTGMRKNSDAS